MPLAQENFDRIRERISDAYCNEDPIFTKFRDYAKNLKQNVKPIRKYSVNAVSFVSADGGDNRIYFNPAVIELVRVVDSRGNQCALDALAGNTKPDAFNLRGLAGNSLTVEPLQKLCNDLGVSVLGLSYFLKNIEEPGKSTGAVRVYRDIVEWAVLYDLLTKSWGSDTIIVREGLLRTKSFKRKIFPKIDESIRKLCNEHKKQNVNVSIVGVAKQSAVLSRLAVALELEETMHKNYPCYVKVPREIENE